MNLFGCKFCRVDPEDNVERCDRKNFDSLLWALVTVFQVRIWQIFLLFILFCSFFLLSFFISLLTLFLSLFSIFLFSSPLFCFFSFSLSHSFFLFDAFFLFFLLFFTFFSPALPPSFSFYFFTFSTFFLLFLLTWAIILSIFFTKHSFSCDFLVSFLFFFLSLILFLLNSIFFSFQTAKRCGNWFLMISPHYKLGTKKCERESKKKTLIWCGVTLSLCCFVL